MTNLREKILDYIVKIQKKETKENVPIVTKKLLYEISKYSSKKECIYHLEINNMKLRKSSEYLVTYICSVCEVETSVGTTQILRKIRNGVLPKCLSCLRSGHDFSNKKKEEDIDGEKQKQLQIECKPEKKDKEEIHQQSIQEFEEKYNDLFQNAYFLSHLTEDDYNRIRKNIISFGNGKYTDLNNYDFWSIYKVNNQMRFSSVIYDKITKNIFKADQPIIKCDNCTKSWRCKSLEKFKNDYKLLCPECKLCNRTFKLRPTKNINNDIIMYQSKLELKFIHWCNNNNFVVTNGPNIPYHFLPENENTNGKSRVYKVDFQINNYLIEIKDFHIWHRNQVKSGLWQCKLDAVNTYITDNKLQKYFFITPQNWNQQIKELLLVLQTYENNLDKI